MIVKLKQTVVTEKDADVYIGRHIYLIILRITNTLTKDQFVRSIVTFNHNGRLPYQEGHESEVVAVYEYRLSDRETVPDYEVFGEDYLIPIQ